jgi:hypothetical protein
MRPDEYLKNLKKRGKESRAYTQHQLLGLEIAEILEDRSHKALYIKLAKERNSGTLLQLAKTIREKKDVKNKGAYFMACMKAMQIPKTQKPTPKKIKKRKK